MRVLKDRISFRHAELNTLHSLGAGILFKLSVFYNPKNRILPEDFEETNKDAIKIRRYVEIFMFKGIRSEESHFPSLEFFKEINLHGIKTMKTCVSLDESVLKSFT